MTRSVLPRSFLFGLGFVLAVSSFAPAPPQAIPKPSSLADARYKAAIKQFDEVWTYYRQSRTQSFPVYYWSRLVLDSERDLNPTKSGRIAALEAHQDRMLKLEELVKKVRKLGFGFSIDVGATEYYLLEAERWLEQARAE
jgi:hypothetical protein